MNARRSTMAAAVAAVLTLGSAVSVMDPPSATAAPTDVVINEMMYHALSDLDGDDYLELHQRRRLARRPVRVELQRHHAHLADRHQHPVRRLPRRGKDAAQFQATYGFAPAAVYGGNLSNSGETVALKDATATTIDTVTFGTGPLAHTCRRHRPVHGAHRRLPRQRRPPQLGHRHQRRRSHSRCRQLRPPLGLGPRIAGVSAKPAVPAAGQPVVVSATVTGQSSVTLRYRIDFAAEQTLTMAPSGPDTYSATIPGAAAGHLIRYRVEATNATATTRSPRVDDTINFRGIVVPHGITSPIPCWSGSWPTPTTR